MAKKTKAELKTQIDANLKTNSTRQITAVKHNSVATNINDSMLNLEEGGLVVDALAGYSSLLTPTDDKHWPTKKYVDDQVSANVPTGVLLAANNLSDLGNLSTAKTTLGINNVDNTSDANKPVSTAQATADALVLSTAEAYADSLVVGLWDDRGNYNASVNTFPASGGSGSAGAVKKGDIWTVSVSGTLGGHAVTAGDTVRALVDTPGQTDSNWAIAENNIGYVPANDSAVVHNTGNETIAGAKTFSSSPIVPTPTADTQATNKSYVDLKSLLGTLGSLYSISGSTWNGNSGSFSKTGAIATFTHGSSKLAVSAGNHDLNQYYSYNTYGTTNLDEFDINGTVAVTNVSATTYGIAFGLQSSGTYSQPSIQFLVDLTTANSGTLSVYLNNDISTVLISSQNSLALAAGDTFSFNIKFIKSKIIFSILVLSGTNIGKRNSIAYNRGTGKGFNTSKFTIYAVGGSQDLTVFSATSSQKKGATALFLGDSITGASGAKNTNTGWVGLIKNTCDGTFETLSGAGDTLADFSNNIAEITSLNAQNIFICASVNDISETGSAATTMARLTTLVNSLVAAGYVVGTNLFIVPATPTGSALVPTLHGLAQAAYPSGYIDQYTGLKDPASGNSLNPLYISVEDTVHPNPDGHRVYADQLIAAVPTVFIMKNNTEPNAEPTPWLIKSNNQRILNSYRYLTVGSWSSNDIVYSTNGSSTPISPVAVFATVGSETDNTKSALYVGSNGGSISQGVYNGSKVIERAKIGFGNTTNTAGSEDGFITIQVKSAGAATAEAFRFGQTGLFGIGLTPSGGYLEIKAGTSTIAPILLTAGTNNATAQAGAIEFTSANLLFTPSGTTRKRVVLTNNATPSNGQIPIGNGTDYTVANITAGNNTTVTNASGSITIDVNSSYVAKTGTYTAAATDYLINCTANSFTVTLPTAVGITGKIYEIVNSGAGTITVGTTSSQTFVNVTATPTTLTLNTVAAKSIRVMSNGANWMQLN